jgi:hypothetical protein
MKIARIGGGNMISTLMTYWFDKDQKYVVTLEDINEFLKHNKVKVRNIKLWELKKFYNRNLDPFLVKESRKNLQPILVVKDLAGNYTDVIDGKHRLANAFMQGEKTIRVREICMKKADKNMRVLFTQKQYERSN